MLARVMSNMCYTGGLEAPNIVSNTLYKPFVNMHKPY